MSQFSVSIITLNPQMFPGPLAESLAGKAREAGIWSMEMCDIRQFGIGKHRQVDDTPAGGGPGMVMRPDCLAAAIDHVSSPSDQRHRLLMSPRGDKFDQTMAQEFAAEPGLVIVCGRFEGVDERIIKKRNLREVSIGDYILSGGEPAALCLLDAVIRLLPGVMGNQHSAETESFEAGLLEYPQYTRPAEFEGQMVPEILTSGHHAKIETWRREEAERLTKSRRPDLLKS